MAISHAQPLLLLFLASLFMLPALGVEFRTCYTGNQKFIEVKTVDMSPYPVKRSGNANVTVTGYTSKDIPDGSVVNLGLSIPMFPVSTKSYSLCDVTACPVAPGPFVLTLSNVFTKKELRSRAYYVAISITEKPGDVPMMCVSFACKIRGYTSLLGRQVA